MNKLQVQILKTLSEYGALDRDALVRILNAARTTIYDNLIELMKYDLVKKYTLPIRSKARPRVLFRIINRPTSEYINHINMDKIREESERLIEKFNTFELCNLIDCLIDSDKVQRLHQKQE